MAILIVMEKNSGRMHVPPEKLQEYLDRGWVEIERIPFDQAAVESKPVKEQAAAVKPKPRKTHQNPSPA